MTCSELLLPEPDAGQVASTPDDEPGSGDVAVAALGPWLRAAER